MTTLRFVLLRRGELLDCKATLRGLRLDLPEGLVQRVECVQRGFPERFRRRADERAAEEAADEICAKACRLAHNELLTYSDALERAADDFSTAQQARYDEDHPTGRSDAQTYREEAPSPWR